MKQFIRLSLHSKLLIVELWNVSEKIWESIKGLWQRDKKNISLIFTLIIIANSSQILLIYKNSSHQSLRHW